MQPLLGMKTLRDASAPAKAKASQKKRTMPGGREKAAGGGYLCKHSQKCLSTHVRRGGAEKKPTSGAKKKEVAAAWEEREGGEARGKQGADDGREKVSKYSS